MPQSLERKAESNMQGPPLGLSEFPSVPEEPNLLLGFNGKLPTLDLLKPDSPQTSFMNNNPEEVSTTPDWLSQFVGIADWFNGLPTNLRVKVAEAVPAATELLRRVATASAEELYWGINVADVVDEKITAAKKRASARIADILAHPDKTAQEIEKVVGGIVDTAGGVVYTVLKHPERIVAPAVVLLSAAACTPAPAKGDAFRNSPVTQPLSTLPLTRAQETPRPTRVENKRDINMPSIDPQTTDKYVANLVARAIGPVSDVGVGVTPDVLLLRKFSNATGALIERSKLGIGSDFTIVVPLSENTISDWLLDPAKEPAWFIERTRTEERYILTVNSKYNEIGLVPMPSNAVIDVTPSGVTSIVIPGKGRWNNMVDKPQLDLRWLPRAGMFLDLSNLPREARDTTKEIEANLDNAYGFAREILNNQDPRAEIDLIPSINDKGELVFAAWVKYSTGQEAVYGQARNGKFYAPKLAVGQFVRLADNGWIVVQIRGDGPSVDKIYDYGIFDPDANNGLGAIVNVAAPATPTPSPVPTVKPTETPRPTATPTRTISLNETLGPPKFTWVSPINLNRGNMGDWAPDKYSNILMQGANVEVTTDSMMGQVLKATVVSESGGLIRGYPDFYSSIKRGPFSMKITVKFNAEFVPSTSDGWVNFFGAFNSGAPNYRILSNVDMTKDGVPYLNVKRPTGGDYKKYFGTIKTDPDKPHTMELRLDEHNILHLIINGVESCSGELPPEYQEEKYKDLIGLVGGHGLMYGNKMRIGAYIMNGPIEINSWE